MTATVVVDFDGVLHAYRGWADGTCYGDWVPGAHQALRAMMRRYAVAVVTARDPKQVAQWLIARGLPVQLEHPGPLWDRRGVLLVTDRKVPAVAYIDDRAVPFTGDWTLALAAVGIDLPGGE